MIDGQPWPVGTFLVCRLQAGARVEAFVWVVDGHRAIDGVSRETITRIALIDDTERYVASARCGTCGHVPPPPAPLHPLADDPLRDHDVVRAVATPRIARYLPLLKRWSAMKRHEQEANVAMFEELDALWYQMTPAELDIADPGGAAQRAAARDLRAAFPHDEELAAGLDLMAAISDPMTRATLAAPAASVQILPDGRCGAHGIIRCTWCTP